MKKQFESIDKCIGYLESANKSQKYQISGRAWKIGEIKTENRGASASGDSAEIPEADCKIPPDVLKYITDAEK